MVGAVVVAQAIGVPGPESEPTVLAAFLAGALVLTLITFYVLARVAAVGYRLAPRVLTRLDRTLPGVPVPTGMGGRMIAVLMGGLLLLAVVYLALLGTTMALKGDLPGVDGGSADRSYAVLPVEDDVVRTTAADGRPGADADGDGLPDAWEEAGETPDGVPLPGAEPDRKDLFVQVNYGVTAPALTPVERRALVRAWAELPVRNPSGEPGVRLHLADGRRQESGLGRLAQVIDRQADHDAFYTREHLGARRCVYHQVVFGQVATGNTTVVASAPGYTVVVDTGNRPEFRGESPWRVYATTHGLLHNVVGTLPDDGPHSTAGWLASPIEPDGNYLSETVAQHVNRTGFTGSADFQNGVCAS